MGFKGYLARSKDAGKRQNMSTYILDFALRSKLENWLNWSSWDRARTSSRKSQMGKKLPNDWQALRKQILRQKKLKFWQNIASILVKLERNLTLYFVIFSFLRPDKILGRPKSTIVGACFARKFSKYYRGCFHAKLQSKGVSATPSWPGVNLKWL